VRWVTLCEINVELEHQLMFHFFGREANANEKDWFKKVKMAASAAIFFT
jgi:hypothetical protein